jgi:uncharacterized protein (TIGR02996 family)
MSERDALLKAVCENPDDDTPRLVFADWLQENGEEERAEFIRLQIEVARRFEAGTLADDDPDEFLAGELERAHGSRWWLGTPPERDGVAFRMWRGFPFWLVVSDRRALKRAQHNTAGVVAVERLTLLNEMNHATAKSFARWKFAPQLRGLELTHLNLWGGPITDFFSTLGCDGLRYLSFRGCELTYSATSALAEQASFTSLRVLDLRETYLGNAGVAALCRSASLANLACLRLEGNMFIDVVHDDLRRRFGDRAKF